MDPLTPKQREAVALVEQYGSVRAAAKATNRSHSTLLGHLAKAAEAGLVPQVSTEAKAAVLDRVSRRDPRPDGRDRSSGAVYSTYRQYRDEDGNLTAEWEKELPSRIEARIAAAAEGFRARIPKAKPVKAPAPANADLLNCYVITDYHLGMLAWHREAGEDWDIGLAEDLLASWFAAAIQQAPKADTAVFAQLGDFLHWDGLEAITPDNANQLDADTRFQKLVEVSIRVLRRVIDMLRAKYRKVTILMCDANHDPASEVWLRSFLAAMYDNEPGVEVDTTADTYYCVEHGKTSLFFHHGHKRKPANIDDVFVAKYRDVFGRTKHSYAHTGHQHHKHVLETNLMEVEQHRTLAPKDAYASRGGWMAKRAAQCITYSKEHGEVGRIMITPEMVS